MSRKPPAHVYAHSVTLQVCTGVDRWNHPAWAEYSVDHVNVQPASGTTMSKDDTEVQLNALLFADSLYTVPALDWWALKDASEAAGQPATVVFENRQYTVVDVAKLFNEFGIFDHWEVALK